MARSSYDPVAEFRRLIAQNRDEYNSSPSSHYARSLNAFEQQDALSEYRKLIEKQRNDEKEAVQRNARYSQRALRDESYARNQESAFKSYEDYFASTSDLLKRGASGKYSDNNTYSEAIKQANEALNDLKDKRVFNSTHGYSYGNAALEGMENSYKELIAELDKQSAMYGKYKDAGEYYRTLMGGNTLTPQSAPEGPYNRDFWEQNITNPELQVDIQQREEPGVPSSLRDPESFRRLASAGARDVTFGAGGGGMTGRTPEQMQGPLAEYYKALSEAGVPVDRAFKGPMHPSLYGYFKPQPMGTALPMRKDAGTVSQAMGSPDRQLEKMREATQKAGTPGMGVYNLYTMTPEQIAETLQRERERAEAAGMTHDPMVANIEEYYATNYSQGAQARIDEIDRRYDMAVAEEEEYGSSIQAQESDVSFEIEMLNAALSDPFNEKKPEELAEIRAQLEAKQAEKAGIIQGVEGYKDRKKALSGEKYFFETVRDELAVRERFAPLWNNEDFLEKSGYIQGDVENLKGFAFSNRTDIEKAYHYINDPEYRKYVMASSMGIGKMGGPVEEELGLDYLTPDQKMTFNYLYNTGSHLQATEFLEGIKKSTQFKRAQSNAEYWQKFGEENHLFAWMMSRGMSVANAMVYPAQVIGVMAFGENEYSSLYDFKHASQSIDAGLRSNAQKNWSAPSPIPGTTWGELLFDTLTSTADTAIAIGVGKGTGLKSASMYLMGSRAGSETFQNAIMEGADNKTALTLSLASLAIESLTEKYSTIDRLFSDPKRVFTHFLKSFAGEFSEEAIANAANLAFDWWVRRDKSTFSRRVRAIMKENPGISQEQANSAALREYGMQAIQEGIQGGFSGVLLGLPQGFALAGSRRTAPAPSTAVTDAIRNREAELRSAPPQAPAAAPNTDAGRQQMGAELAAVAMGVDPELAEEVRKTFEKPVTSAEVAAVTAKVGEALNKGVTRPSDPAITEAGIYSQASVNVPRTADKGQNRVSNALAIQARLDEAIARREEAVRKRDEALQRLGRTRQGISQDQLARWAQMDTELTELLRLQQRAADLQAAQTGDNAAPASALEMQSIESEMDRLGVETTTAAPETVNTSQGHINTALAMQVRLDDAIARREEAYRKRDEALQRLGRVKQGISQNQLAKWAQMDADYAALQELRQRTSDLQSVQPADFAVPEVAQEVQAIETEMERLGVPKDVVRPTDPALTEQGIMPEPRQPAARPVDPALTERFLALVDNQITPYIEKQGQQEFKARTVHSFQAGSRQVSYRSQMTEAESATAAELRAQNAEMSDEAFSLAAEAAFAAGLNNSEALVQNTALLKDMQPETVQALFNAGLERFNKTRDSVKTRADAVIARMSKPGLGTTKMSVNVSDLTMEQKKLAKALQEFSRAYGLNIEIFQSRTDAQGNYIDEQGSFDPATGLLRFDINAGLMNVSELQNPAQAAAKLALPRVMGHEFTHYLKTVSPEGYAVYQEAVLSQLGKAEGLSLDDLVMQKMGRARKTTLTYAEAVEEVISDASERMFQNTTLFEGVMKSDQGLYQRFKNWLAQFKTQFQERMKRSTGGHMESAALMEMRDGAMQYMGDLQQQWDAMMKGAFSRQSALGTGVQTQKVIPSTRMQQAQVQTQTQQYAPATKMQQGESVTERVTPATAASTQAVGQTQQLSPEIEAAQSAQARLERTFEAGSRQVAPPTRTAQGVVEQTKNLVAIHNLGENELAASLESGGIPMPSIAVTKSEMGHDWYGDYSVLFGRDTIDPQADSRNKVYSSDAWTQTHPGQQEDASLEQVLDSMIQSQLQSNVPQVVDAVEQYTSVDQMKSKSSRLGMAENYAEIKANLTKQFEDVVAAFDKSKNPIGRKNRRFFIAETLRTLLQKGNPTVEAIQSEMEFINSKEIPVNSSRENAQMFYDLLQDIYNIPTGYFEAKPQRIVENSEIRGVLIPDNASESIRKTLSDAGITAIEYKRGDSADRLRALNSAELEGVRFSERDTQYLAAVESGDMDTAQKMVDEAADMAMLNSKIRDEDGKLIAVYHGTDADFNVFDRAKSRANMDIQGNFFSPWEEDAAGYGRNVRKFYLNITNPATESIGYKALRQYQGQNNAGVKARDYLERRGYDGVDNGGEEYITFDSAQAKSADPVTYDDSGKPIPLSQRFNSASPDIRYQERDSENTYQVPAIEVTDAMKESVLYEGQPMYAERDPSNVLPDTRSILAGAFGEVAKTSAEKQKVAQYRANIGVYNGFEAELKRLEAQKGGTQAEVQQRKARMQDLRAKLTMADSKLLELERSKPLRDIVRREHDQAYQVAAERGRQRLTEYRERAVARDERGKHIGRIEKTAQTLYQWAANPDSKKHIPEDMRTAVSDVLQSLDMAWTRDSGETVTSRRSRSWQEAMGNLSQRMQAADAVSFTVKDGDKNQFVIDLDPDLATDIAQLLQDNDSAVRYRDMNAEQLGKLSDVMERVKHAVTNANKLHSNARNTSLSELAGKSIGHLQSLREKKLRGTAVERISTMLNLDMADAFTYFDSLGTDARSILDSLYKRGFGKLVANTKEAQAFFEELNAKYKGAGIAKWSGKKAEAQTFQVSGGQVTLTPGQIMELYLLNKREQARGHIYGNGIRIAQAKARQDGKGKWIGTTAPVTVTESDVAKIIGSMTAEQKSAAEDFAKFLATTSSAWGNEVSMELYGYLKFTEQNYFPIKSDQNYTATTDPDKAREALNALVNLGMTKSTVKGANNAIVIGDVFDTVAQHVTDMANYNAFAVPLSDAMKWFNYKQETTDGAGKTSVQSVKSSIERAHGKGANQYFVNLLKGVNGIKNAPISTGFSGILNSMTGKMKTAAVAGNVRVIIQQHTSYARASAMMNIGDLAGAYFKNQKRGMEMAQKYSPIAAWKAMGYYDMNIGRNMNELISGRTSLAGKVKEAAMKPAGWADNFTLGMLWNAAEIEVGRTYKGDKKSEDFYKKVGDRLTDVIDRTQVVDTIFHRAAIMRDKDGLIKMSTNFMSEPIKTYNLLMNAVRTKNAGTIARTGVSVLSSFVLTAMAAGLIDAGRDEEKEKGAKGYWKSYMKQTFGVGGSFFESNVWDNANPLGMIPGAKEIYALAGGYSPSRPDLVAAQRIIWAANDWMKVFNREYDGNIYDLAYKTAAAISTTTGLPINNVMRDVMATYNTLNPEIIVGDGGMPAKLAFDRYATALEEGDEQKALEYYNAVLKSGKGSDEIRTGLMSMLKTNESVISAAAAKREGRRAEYERLVEEVAATGYPRDIVLKAVAGLLTEKSEDVEEGPVADYGEMQSRLQYDSAVYSYSYEDVAAVYDTGDMDEVRRVTELLVKEGRKRSDILSNIKGVYKDRYVAGEMTREQAGERLKQLNPEISENDLFKELRKWDYVSANGSEDGYSVYNDFRAAVLAGGPELKKVIKQYLDPKTFGYEKGDLSSEITRQFKDEYIRLYQTNKAEASRLKARLLTAYEALGYKRQYKSKDIDDWLKPDKK